NPRYCRVYLETVPCTRSRVPRAACCPCPPVRTGGPAASGTHSVLNAQVRRRHSTTALCARLGFHRVGLLSTVPAVRIRQDLFRGRFVSRRIRPLWARGTDQSAR